MDIKREQDSQPNNVKIVMQKNLTPEQILDVKKQGEEVLYLVKWIGQDISKATWQSPNQGLNLHHLLRAFKYSKKSKPKRKEAAKIFSKVENGINPYEQTNWQGHFLYGDKPKTIVSLKVFENNKGKSVLMEIQWKPRLDGTILQNSLIDTRVITEHDPDFLLKYYESKVQLKHVRGIYKPKKISNTNKKGAS